MRRITICILLAVTLFFGAGPSWESPVLGAETKPFSVTGSYSVQENARFSGEYRNGWFGMNLDVEEDRWRFLAGLRLQPNWELKGGYDFTQESYLARLNHKGKIGENLLLSYELTGFWPRLTGKNYWEYEGRLNIGMGEDNLIAPGIKGRYEQGVSSDPELYLLLDLNWHFANDWRLRFEPVILVEGGLYHRTTITKELENGVKTGIFFGQNEEYKWDIGAFITY